MINCSRLTPQCGILNYRNAPFDFVAADASRGAAQNLRWGFGNCDDRKLHRLSASACHRGVAGKGRAVTPAATEHAMPVDPQIQALLDQGTGVPATHTLPLDVARAQYEARIA